MKQNLYARKKRQFLHLSDQVDCLRQDGQWEVLDTSVRQRLTRKLKSLYREIYGYFSRSEWKRAVAAVGFLIIGGSAVQAQQFGTPVQNAHGLALSATDYWMIPTLIDIDQDGDLDVFGSSYYGQPMLYKNNGTASNSSFAPAQVNPYGLTGAYTLYSAVADIDGDGDMDVLASGYNYGTYSSQTLYFENTGTAQNPSFGTPQANPFGIAVPPTGYLFDFELADLDNDGDLDLLAKDVYYGNYYYFQNNGTSNSPAFGSAQLNPFGLTSSGAGVGVMSLGDMDMDGDLDVMATDYYGNYKYYENTGSSSAAAFGAPQTNPFGLVPNGYYNFTAVGDLDDDGDMDVLSVAYQYSYAGGFGSFYYYENTDPSIGLEEQELNADVYPNPFADRITVELGDVATGMAEVFDLTGKRVFRTSFADESELRLDLSGLTAGLYLLQVDSDAGSKTLKITKQ